MANTENKITEALRLALLKKGIPMPKSAGGVMVAINSLSEED